MDGMGVNITIMSYRGTLHWGIHASPDTIPRIWDLAAAIPSALDELLLAAGEPPATERSESAAAVVRAPGTVVDGGRDGDGDGDGGGGGDRDRAAGPD
jgi:hypothetical protein